MIDLNDLNSEKALEFLESPAYKNVAGFLFLENLTCAEISGVSMKDGTVMAHPLVALEYARWLDYDKFAAWALSKLPET